MADFYINIFLDGEKTQKLEAAGLSGLAKDVEGKKALQVAMTAKDQKKLIKGFTDLKFDASNACVLPQAGEDKLFGIIMDMRSVDVMKFAITKLYSPLAGRDVFGRGTGMR